MKCPICGNPVSQPGGHCPHCGTPFGAILQMRLADYFALRREWEDLMETNTALSRQLKKMAGRILNLEESIRADLAQLGASTPEYAPPTITDRGEEHSLPETFQQIPDNGQTRPVSHGREKKTADLSDRLKKQIFDPEFKIGQRALLFIGIITMVFGVAFFLKYSFEQGWIGPAGRVALAYLWGIAFLVTGHFMKQKKFPAFGLSLFGGGIAVLYFATYAAFQIYHLVPQTLSFSIMILITVLACATAVVYETQALALLGLIGGFGTPILLATGQDNHMVLFSYMALLNFGILGISFRKRWVILQYAGFAVTWILFTGWFAEHYSSVEFGDESSKFWAALIFLNLFYLIYSIIPFAYHFLNREKHDLKGFYILMLNSLIGLAYNYVIIERQYSAQWVSLVTVAYAFLFIFFAYRIYRQGESQRAAFIIMLLNASFFLVLTVPLIFSKHWITIFWALQAMALLVGARKLVKKEFFVMSFILLFLALIKFTVYDLSVVFRYDLDPSFLYIGESFGYRIVERWLAILILAGSLYQFLRMAARGAGGQVLFGKEGDRPVFAALFGSFVFIVMTLETSAFFHDYLIQARFAAMSIAWTLFAMVIMVLGFKGNRDIMRKVSLALLFVTVFKVFLFDISRISTPYRILSFIVLGLILILISYLYTKAKQKLIESHKIEGDITRKCQ
ncbi:MAG: DUF2339 domain-containing protein [Syntrophorhabdaceae bacterium]